MPLRDRLPKHDTIAEFEKARLDRFRDSLVLAARGRRHGAIYLLGYFVEMTLKIAFFRCFGFHGHEPILGKDLKAAAQLAKEDLGVAEETERYHNPLFWTRAIIAAQTCFGSPWQRDLIIEFEGRSERLNANWAVSMRYTRALGSQDDWQSMRDDAVWIHAICATVATMNDEESQ